MSLAGPTGSPRACSGLMYWRRAQNSPGRRHVLVRRARRLEHPSPASVDVVRTEQLGQAPVHHQRLAVGAEHDVRRLQVAVNDPLIVSIGTVLQTVMNCWSNPRNVRPRRPGSRRSDSSSWKASIASCKVWPWMKGMV